MIGKLIALFHLIVAFLYSFYAFIFPANFLSDYIYFIFLSLIQTSWVIYCGECPISYYYKKLHYTNYECGLTTSLDDFNELNLVGSNNQSYLGDNIFTFFLISSIIITGMRSKMANIFLIIFVYIFLRFFYVYLNNAIGHDSDKIAKQILLGHEKTLIGYVVKSD
jgi:hypothetical protein